MMGSEGTGNDCCCNETRYSVISVMKLSLNRQLSTPEARFTSHLMGVISSQHVETLSRS